MSNPKPAKQRPAAKVPASVTASVRRAAAFIDARQQDEADGPITLEELGRHCGLSPWHLQRQFKRVMGVTPRDYEESLRLARFKKGLRTGAGVAAATFDAGFGSSSRVYERAGTALGMTPASYASGGKGAAIRYALAPSTLGQVLVAATGKGLCRVEMGADADTLIEDLAAEFPEADAITRDDRALGPYLAEILRRIAGKAPLADLPLDIRMTAFQRQVWQALSRIPTGETRTYGAIAAAIGQPGAARAVGNTCGRNPVAIAIPCHRVLRNDGAIGGYAWGSERKQALIRAESTSLTTHSRPAGKKRVTGCKGHGGGRKVVARGFWVTLGICGLFLTTMRKVAKNLAKSLTGASSAAVDKARVKRKRMAEASDIHMLSFATRKVPLVFKPNKRAQRIILRLDHGNSSIIVVLPKRTSRDEGKRFALSNKDWIEQRLDQLHEPVPFLHNAVIPILGTPHRIRHKPNARGVVWCESEEINVAGHEEHVPRRVQDWLKIEAKREIELRATQKAEAIGKKIKKITIRDTKSRWGSCTSEGELAFSWRLIFAPRHVMDYVIAHEVAHLREMNHGPKFWKLCGEICRQVEPARLWLENHGTDLYRYGRF